MKIATYLILINLLTPIALFAASDDDSLPEIEVEAKKINVKDQVVHSGGVSSIEKIQSDENIGKAISKLPGHQVKNLSGGKSLTTVTTPQALNAASTSISVDSIPVVDPAGVGVNVSLLPGSMFDSVESMSAFYPMIDNSAVHFQAPGGRLNFRTHHSKPHLFNDTEHVYHAGLLLGTANTADLNASLIRYTEKYDWSFGFDLQNTKGNVRYVNPDNGNHAVRENNDSVSWSIMEKLKYRTSKTGSIDVLETFSRQHRTNPGSLNFPSRDHQKDTFNLFGISFFDSEYFTPSTGAFAKLSNTYTRVQNDIDLTTRTDSHALGTYAMAGTSLRHDLGESIFSLEDLDERLNDSTGKHFRNGIGITHATTFRVSDFSLIPSVRYENSTAFGDIADAFGTILYNVDSSLNLSASVGYTHAYYPIMASSGYNAGNFFVLPNDDLKVERDLVTEASARFETKSFSLFVKPYYTVIYDRAVYVSKSFVTAKYENVPNAYNAGVLVDSQVSLTNELSTRAYGNLAKTLDRNTGREFPFKPPYTAGLSVHYAVNSFYGVTLEEEWIGKRFINLTDSQSLSPYQQTNLRIDLDTKKYFGGGRAFLKCSNVFENSGYVTPGYPYLGREIFLGFQI